MARTVLAIVGMPGAGKSSVASWFAKRGAHVVRLGQVIIDEVEARGMEVSEESERSVREQLRLTGGPLAIADIAFRKVSGLLEDGSWVVVDGIYSLDEYLFFKEKLDQQLVVVCVHSAPGLRYQRLADRKERPLEPSVALQRDISELCTLSKGGPIAMADAVLVNDGTWEQLERQIKSILPAWGCQTYV